MAVTDLSPPPQKQDPKFDNWMYRLWLRARASVDYGVIGATSPIVATSGTGTVGISHAVSGVTPGTYGGASAIPQIVVNTHGHVTSVGTFAAGASSGELSNFITGGTTTMGTYASRVYAAILTIGTDGGLLVPSTSNVAIAG